ncbi:MAG: OmpA family protein [Woeseia sp.]
MTALRYRPARWLRYAAVAPLLLLTSAYGAPFEIQWQSDTLLIAGETSSEGHEQSLRRVAAEAFPGASIEMRVTRGNNLPPGWSLVTELALRVLALAPAGSAGIDAGSVVLRGNYTDAAAWTRAVTRLAAALPQGLQIRDEALFDPPLVQPASAPRSDFAAMCRQQFRRVLRERQVEFRINSSELRSSTYPLLDALVEIAADCPAVRIHITGHTDASGESTLNLQLSQLRATAVLNYLVERGISPERLSAAGAGATRLISESPTAAARARNRRIEFDFETGAGE